MGFAKTWRATPTKNAETKHPSVFLQQEVKMEQVISYRTAFHIVCLAFSLFPTAVKLFFLGMVLKNKNNNKKYTVLKGCSFFCF